MALSTKPYKGARDFYPEAKRLQKYIFGKWRGVAERFGYEEYDAPILEPLEIYAAKTGDEIVSEQTYAFEDRGGRKVVIRPEMTPTVSRMVAGKRQELGYPLRWYSIPNLWRYERPQKGRLREHWQLNVDIFGVKDTSAELEIIKLVDSAFKEFGAKPSMYEIRLNHRGLIDHLLADYLGLGANERAAIGKLIDRLHKMERSVFISKIDAVLTNKQRAEGVTEKLLALLDAKKLQDLPKEAQNRPSFNDLKSLQAQLKQAGISNVRFEGTLMRGFDYYTGIVFEVFDMDPENNRSLLGGGRYDGLVGLFGVDAVPTVGFGWGDVTLSNFLEVHHLMPKLQPETDIYVALVGDVSADNVPTELRSNGLNVAVDLSRKKIGDQLKTADKKGILNVLIIGEEELKSSKYKLKNLQTGKEENLSLNEVAKKIKAGK
jgi:histidyl-tRNA synthetase